MSVNWVAFWDNLYRSFGIVHEKPDALVAQTIPLLHASGVKSVLDLGSGTGRHAALLAEYGFRVVAMDAAPAALALSQKRLEEFPRRLEHALIRQVTQKAYDLVQGVDRKERQAFERLPKARRIAVCRRLSRDAVMGIEYALPPSSLSVLTKVAWNALADEGISPALPGNERVFETRLTELLRPLYTERILLVPGDMRRLPFADGRFDCVLVHNVLKFCAGNAFHLAIRESQRVLKPGGISIVKATSALGRRLGPNDRVQPCTSTKPSGLPRQVQQLPGKADLLAAYEGHAILDLRLVMSSAPTRSNRFAIGSRLDWWLVARKGAEGRSGAPNDTPRDR